MKLGIVLFVVVLFSGACASFRPGCLIQEQGTAIVSRAIVDQLQCYNGPEVEKSVDAMFNKLNLCPSGKQGPIADALCPAVSQLAVSLLADSTIPASWECTAANAKAAIQAAVEKACRKIPQNKK